MGKPTRIPGTLPEHLSRDGDNELAADITAAEMVEQNMPDGHLRQERWIVDGVTALPQRTDPTLVTVWSPCCGRPRHRLRHGYAFSCPSCGWWWRYHWVGWTSRTVSIGKENPL